MVFTISSQLSAHCRRLTASQLTASRFTDRKRAASSIVLNLAEGWGKQTNADQKRFYEIALGSLRESQAILEIASIKNTELIALADKLAAHLYRLILSKRG